MRIVKLLMVISLALSATACSKVVSETSEDLGFGFRRVLRSETNPSWHWEAVSHFSYFYYKDTELGQSNKYSIAPSGRYAIFQNGPSGKIMIFKPGTGQLIDETSKFIGLVYEIKWNEPEKFATVLFYGGQQPMKISLE